MNRELREHNHLEERVKTLSLHVRYIVISGRSVGKRWYKLCLIHAPTQDLPRGQPGYREGPLRGPPCTRAVVVVNFAWARQLNANFTTTTAWLQGFPTLLPLIIIPKCKQRCTCYARANSLSGSPRHRLFGVFLPTSYILWRMYSRVQATALLSLQRAERM